MYAKYGLQSVSTAITRNGSDYFQNPFFVQVLGMEATCVPSFKSIGPDLEKLKPYIKKLCI